MEVGEEGEYIPIATLQHFNVSLIVRDKVTRQCPQTTTFLKRKESRSGIEPSIEPLGQTGSPHHKGSPSFIAPTHTHPPTPPPFLWS